MAGDDSGDVLMDDSLHCARHSWLAEWAKGFVVGTVLFLLGLPRSVYFVHILHTLTGAGHLLYHPFDLWMPGHRQHD